jgi:hypothetical protein
MCLYHSCLLLMLCISCCGSLLYFNVLFLIACIGFRLLDLNNGITNLKYVKNMNSLGTSTVGTIQIDFIENHFGFAGDGYVIVWY